MVNPFYKSSRWLKKRDRALRRDHYECQECKRYGKATPATTVHHILPVQDYPQYRLLLANLLSLCSTCHNQMHDRVTDALTEKGIRWQERTVLPPPIVCNSDTTLDR
ncbi:HNH endonuclease [Sporosarcina sp. NCCP-2716]|uniref:HNH endonuclease n=1 Tax=Sporosarcina sp. NCCP-2716 TaxID=2943679 RepID=UPI0020411FBB|nr:HNH endonuclease [Sporosarcina sp. NCCP-2716]